MMRDGRRGDVEWDDNRLLQAVVGIRTGRSAPMSISSGLIAWTLGFFFVLAAVGWVSKLRRFWDFIDPIYYALSAFGVVLLFLGAENTRYLLDLREQLANNKYRLAEQERSKPWVTYVDNFSLLKNSYRLVQGEWDLGKSCTYSLQLSCVAARQRLPSIVKAFAGYAVPAEAHSDADRIRALQDFCSRGANLIDLLIQEKGTSYLIFTEVRINLQVLARLNLTAPGYGSVKEARSALERSLAIKKAELLPRIASANRDDVETLWNEHARAAVALHFAFSLCALTPPVGVGSQSPEDWSKEYIEALDEREHISAAIEQTKSDDSQTEIQNLRARFQFKWWPFVLALALSLKFGKAIHGLRPKSKPSD
jgi:hypothetical protein